MGCAICKKRDPSGAVMNRADQNGFRDLFHGTNEFDLSRSDSEAEEEGEEGHSPNLWTTNAGQSVTKTVPSANELHSANDTSAIITNNIVNNEAYEARF